MAWRHGYTKNFEFVACITTGTGNTTLVAAPGAGRRLRVQSLIICLTTVAAQAFDIEDSSGTVEIFKGPASLVAGPWPVDPGPEGHGLTINEALVYTATAGVGMTISGWGWIQENAT